MRLLNRYLLAGIAVGFIGMLYYANFRQPAINFDRFLFFSWF